LEELMVVNFQEEAAAEEDPQIPEGEVAAVEEGEEQASFPIPKRCCISIASC
jgi:hypothetical protein